VSNNAVSAVDPAFMNIDRPKSTGEGSGRRGFESYLSFPLVRSFGAASSSASNAW
jgi:hypothetical protein